MAQSVNDIQNAILTAITANAILANLNSPSQTSYYRLWTFISAVNYQIEQQMWDETQAQLQNLLFQNAPGTPQWLQQQVLNYQYGYTVQLNSNYQPYYPVIDTGATIVTQCSVTQDDARNVLVKVAGGTPGSLTPIMTGSPINGLIAYLDAISFCGINIVVSSNPADQIYIPAQIFYNGQYVEADVQQNVIDAINQYLFDMPFDGTIYLSRLETAILSVQGVDDVQFGTVTARNYSTPYGAGNPVITRTYVTQAGYIIGEQTSGYTLLDSITMQLSL